MRDICNCFFSEDINSIDKCRSFFMPFVFCVYDICHIPPAVKNTDHGNSAAVVMHGVVDDKVIYGNFVHSHAFPRLPIYEGMAGRHEVKRTNLFPDAVYLFF